MNYVSKLWIINIRPHNVNSFTLSHMFTCHAWSRKNFISHTNLKLQCYFIHKCENKTLKHSYKTRGYALFWNSLPPKKEIKDQQTPANQKKNWQNLQSTTNIRKMGSGKFYKMNLWTGSLNLLLAPWVRGHYDYLVTSWGWIFETTNQVDLGQDS